MIMKKNTDVYTLKLIEADESVIIKVKGVQGEALTIALESILGSPALDDYKNSKSKDFNKVVITRYRLPKTTKFHSQG